MTEPPVDTWQRDVSVLRAIVPALDTQSLAMTDAIAEDLGLPERDVKLAMRNLHRGGQVVAHIMHDGGGDWDIWASDVTRDGLERSGAWPTPETAVDRLVAALEQIAQNTDDEEERTRLQQFAAFLKTGGKQVGLSLVTSVLTGQVT